MVSGMKRWGEIGDRETVARVTNTYLVGLISSRNSGVLDESGKLGVLGDEVIKSLELALHSVKSTDLNFDLKRKSIRNEKTDGCSQFISKHIPSIHALEE